MDFVMPPPMVQSNKSIFQARALRLADDMCFFDKSATWSPFCRDGLSGSHNSPGTPSFLQMFPEDYVQSSPLIPPTPLENSENSREHRYLSSPFPIPVFNSLSSNVQLQNGQYRREEPPLQDDQFRREEPPLQMGQFRKEIKPLQIGQYRREEALLQIGQQKKPPLQFSQYRREERPLQIGQYRREEPLLQIGQQRKLPLQFSQCRREEPPVRNGQYRREEPPLQMGQFRREIPPLQIGQYRREEALLQIGQLMKERPPLQMGQYRREEPPPEPEDTEEFTQEYYCLPNTQPPVAPQRLLLDKAERERMRYYSMTPEERKEFNIRRYEKEKKRKADRKERNELEALLTASNDIQHDKILERAAVQRVKRLRWAEKFRRKYQQMLPEERKEFNKKKLLRKVARETGIVCTDVAAGDKPEVLTDFLEQTKKNHAEAEKRRYHALPAEEKLKKSRQRQQKQREDKMMRDMLRIPAYLLGPRTEGDDSRDEDRGQLPANSE